MMLVKDRDQSTYFLSKNLEIKLLHRRFGYTSNAKIVEALKSNDIIDITIEDDHTTKDLFSNSRRNDKDKCNDLEQMFTTSNKYERFFLLMSTISNINNFSNIKIKKLYDLYIKNKHTKIIRHKNITLISKKLQDIHADV